MVKIFKFLSLNFMCRIVFLCRANDYTVTHTIIGMTVESEGPVSGHQEAMVIFHLLF